MLQLHNVDEVVCDVHGFAFLCWCPNEFEHFVDIICIAEHSFFFFFLGAGTNSKDDKGNTPLHLAVLAAPKENEFMVILHLS